MDLFEIVIIALFLLLPVLEGIFKQRKKRGGGVEAPVPEPPTPGTEGPDRAEAGTSEDILPDELWEELVGEKPGASTEPTGQESPDVGTGAPGEVAERTEPREAEPAERTRVPQPLEAGRGVEEGREVSFAGERDGTAAEREALRREMAAGRRRPGGGRSRDGELRRVRPGRLARRGAAPVDGVHPLVGEVDDEALRRAVVWREVLGPPLARRRRGGKE